ncbi:MAG: aminotransferase class V-fold PLP-dependent enzyme [Ignavibacteriales bacterium]|nr:MAG: aminotransferase class V-fold PLP-dependent enzyme [Ignavibacteriaceae bacterium]MBW7872453.1 aminotransferase class V-fold PLP-dependent enzyme [Ignavibacteria bacterium]MCZ2141994.1 aminotransferase class V-fold PLP-dependent enzyme [Ignavibacteriales bacterium]OQY70677.1 MAG: hypothetical protein B6D45_10855 [Ignavibacteriales bacterium UTCHB3]MBV6445160.1 Isopenicillin N epimerase [Ignavibacteriaceae bacterium]
MTIQEVRGSFPYLKLGKIYLNHAALSPVPQAAIDKANLFLKRRSETHIDDMSEYVSETTEAKGMLAKLVNGEPDRFAFFDNTATGLNILTHGLKWNPGDRVLLNDVEFPSNVYPFLNLKNQGVEVDFVHSKHGAVSSDDILSAVKPGTRLISISAVQYLSGYRANLKRIGEFCREKGIIFCVDAVQALGALSVDVKECKIDFLSCGTQKWLLALMGLSFIYITEELQNEITYGFVGWDSMESQASLLDFNFDMNKSADALQNGTINMIGVNALIGALEVIQAVGIPEIEKRIVAHTIYMNDRLTELGLKPLSAEYATKNLSGIVSFTTPRAKMLYEKFSEAKIYTSMREGYVRLSHHFYNTTEELDAALKIIRDCNC